MTVADRDIGNPVRQTASYNYTVVVQYENIAPWARDIPDQTIFAGNLLAVDVQAFDENDDVLTYSLDQASIDRGLSIDSLGRIRWQTTPADVIPDGVMVFVQVTDGIEVDQKGFLLTVLRDDVAPSVQITVSAPQVDIGDFVDVRVFATDDVGVTGRTLTLASVTDISGNVITLNENLAINAAGYARVDATIALLGTMTFTATAIDAVGNEATATPATVQVIDPSDNDAPVVNLLPPTGDLLAPTDLLGTILDDTPDVIWTLTLSPAEDGLGNWTRTIATGNGLVPTTDTLGLFDPTILANGSYLVTLSATDAGGNTAIDREYIDVDTDLKLGNFSLSFTDLDIPVAGLPITITRSYDTLDAANEGDFGYGWSLDINMPELRLAQASTGPPSFKGFPTFVNGTRLTVTTPEGNNEGFTFKWVQKSDGLDRIGKGTTYRPSFVPDPGNEYSLTAPAEDGRFRKLTQNGPYQDDFGRLYSGQDPYFGGVYQLKQSDPRGRQVDYDILVGPRGQSEMTAHRMSDKYGNSLEIRDDGIFSNRGRSVTFTRDARGRITSITDPRGAQLRYSYDAQGRLTEFYDRRATERLDDEIVGNEFEPTRFAYDIRESIERNELASGINITPAELDVVISQIPGADNYLSTITDPLGVDALQADYGRDGRLGGLVDAQGNPSKLEYDITPEGATVSSESTGLSQTSSSFDGYGRLVTETTALGQTTLYTYLTDTIRYPHQTIQVVGDPDGAEAWRTLSGDDRVTTRGYHPEFDGAVTTETDPDGNTTITAYNTWSFSKGTPNKVYHPDGTTTEYVWHDFNGDGQLQLSSQIDSYGNATSYDYDPFGNVTRIANGNTFTGTNTFSGFTYDTFGDLVEVIDQDGNVRSISYNVNGDQVGTEVYYYATDQRPPTRSQLDDPNVTITAVDYPVSRTLLRTENDVNFSGDVTGSRTYVTEQTLDTVTLTYIDGTTSIRNESGSVEFDALGRAARTTDENGRISEAVYDARGLAIETRSESPDETGSGVWLISRTVYDSEGRSVYSTGSFPEGTDPSQITGTHTVYEEGTGRITQTQQLLGITVDIVGSASILGTQVSSLTSTGTVISSSRSFYDDNDRVIETENNYGLKSQTLYDVNGRVIESRSQVAPASGATQGDWLVSRTIFDDEGKVIASTDRFLVPFATQLGADPLVPVATQITKTIYDSRDRTVATERYAGALVGGLVASQDADVGPVGFVLLSEGSLESVSETLYDAAGRVYRTVSGRVPLASLSLTALAQDQTLVGYPIYAGGVDRYADDANLSSRYHFSDTLFDDRGRQYASLSHPLPAADLGLTGANYGGNLVRIRSETLYNRNGQTERSRSGLAHVESPDGTFVTRHR